MLLPWQPTYRHDNTTPTCTHPLTNAIKNTTQHTKTTSKRDQGEREHWLQRTLQLRNKNMINFSHGSTTIAILLLATTVYGQCEYNTLTTSLWYKNCQYSNLNGRYRYGTSNWGTIYCLYTIICWIKWGPNEAYFLVYTVCIYRYVCIHMYIQVCMYT